MTSRCLVSCQCGGSWGELEGGGPMLQEYLAFSEENRTVVMMQVQASPPEMGKITCKMI